MKLLPMIPTIALLVAAILSLPACAAKTMRPLAPGELAVEILPDADIRIVQTTARQDGEAIVVDGQIKRKLHRRLIGKGHIDIAITDVDGKTIHETFTSYGPEVLPRAEGLRSSFMVRIPVVAPLGSRVSVRFHSGPHEI